MSPKDLYGEEAEDDSENNRDEYEIILTENNRFKTSFHAPSFFFSQIIGSKGMTKKRIENETKTQIKIPRQGVEGDISITGPTKESVSSARRRIEIIVLAGRNKQQFTHFLSIPITSDQIRKEFKSFKNDILPDLEEKLFQNPKKLHITIATLSLLDNEDRALAAQYLQDCQETIIKPILQEFNSIEIKMSGIEYMNDDPSSVDVLYGKIISEPLQLIADKMMDYFVGRGLMQPRNDHVKLHVTLINSLFKDESTQNDSKGERLKFDARKILKKYENFNFGSLVLKEIHLSQRYSTACDGFYEATGIVKI